MANLFAVGDVVNPNTVLNSQMGPGSFTGDGGSGPLALAGVYTPSLSEDRGAYQVNLPQLPTISTRPLAIEVAVWFRRSLDIPEVGEEMPRTGS